MTVTTGPTQINPSHHVKLTDGTNTVGLVLVDGYGNPDVRGFQRNPTGQPIKMYQGTAKYDDSLPPWTPVTMSDFSGGMGKNEFDNDKSSYYWGNRAYTHDGKFMIGPQPVWTTGLYRYWPHYFALYAWRDLTATYPYMATKFTTTATKDIDYIHFIAKGDISSLKVSIYSDSGGSPNAIVDALATATVTAESITGEHVVVIDTNGKLASATDYWIVWQGTLTGTQTISILGADDTAAPTSKKGTTVPAWSAVSALESYAPFYVLGTRYSDRKYTFFEYKGSLFVVNRKDDGSTSGLSINGDQGVVKAGSSVTDVTIDSGFATWTADQAIGSIMVIMAGTGSTQPRNFRVIEDNDATSSGDTLFTFDNDPWDIAPDATSEVAIVASNKWTGITPDITGTNPWTDKTVTDVLVANDAVYFALGDANDMTRMRIYNSTGTWTAEWNVEAADSECTYLAQATDPEGSFIWKAKGGNPANVAKAPSVDCSGTAAAADLVWEDEIGVGDTGARITKMLEYGEDYGQLHILKENGLYKVNLASDDTDYITRIPISAFPNTKDWRNGRTAVVHDTYLFFSWHDTILRYYRNYLDNIGPNSQDMSTPQDYRGIISGMLSYPGMLVACIDAGDNGYSTVNAYNGNGWCNLFTAPAAGLRVRGIYVQSIPGDAIDRLWISCADEIAWIPLSVNPYEHPTTTYNSYNQAWDANLQMGMMYAGRKMLPKYWKEMQFHVYNDEYKAATSAQDTHYVGLYDYALNTLYGYDPSDVSVSSYDEIEIGYSLPYIKPKVTIRGAMPTSYFALDALIFKAVVLEETNWIDTLTVRISDRDKDLGGDYDDIQTASAKLSRLTTWSNGTVLTMTSSVGELDTKSVFIARGGIRLQRIEKDDMNTTYICQVICYELD